MQIQNFDLHAFLRAMVLSEEGDQKLRDGEDIPFGLIELQAIVKAAQEHGIRQAQMAAQNGTPIDLGNPQADRLREKIKRAHKLFVECMKEVGLGDGEIGWIEHSHEDKLVRDPLSLDGEILFGFEAIKEALSRQSQSENDTPPQSSTNTG